MAWYIYAEHAEIFTLNLSYRVEKIFYKTLFEVRSLEAAANPAALYFAKGNHRAHCITSPLHSPIITTCTMETPYTLTPLNIHTSSFRLVSLQPSGPSDLLKCNLQTHPLPPSCPTYIALSYRWGDDQPHDAIELNGLHFPVGHSLWTFLNQMRQHGMFTLFWIDALCIDQSNVLERNHQVQNMRKIYSEARSVSIWIGDAVPGTLRFLAMDFLLSLEPPNGRNLVLTGENANWTTEEAIAIRVLCEDEYWDRMWIVQEVVLARRATLHCGARHVDFKTFKKLMVGLNEICPTPASSLCKYVGVGKRKSLFQALVYCGKRSATDIRDRIYALLGVVEEAASSIPIDYALSLEELWCVVFDYLCRMHARSGSAGLAITLGRKVADALEITVSDDVMFALAYDARSSSSKEEAHLSEGQNHAAGSV